MARGLTLTKFFFDRDLIIRSMDKKSRDAMYRAGNNVKRIAQNSMRYRKTPSASGSPPSAHKDGKRGPALRKFLFNVYDPIRRSQVIGPQPLGRNIVPKLMEQGGTEAIVVTVPRTVSGRVLSAAAKAAFRRRLAAGLIAGAAATKSYRIARYPARPFMWPAEAKSRASYPRLWAGNLKAA